LTGAYREAEPVGERGEDEVVRVVPASATTSISSFTFGETRSRSTGLRALALKVLAQETEARELTTPITSRQGELENPSLLASLR
jgi:hypothetical protein